MCNCGCETLNDLDHGCDYITHKRFGNNPAEYCDAETIPGTDHCPDHQGDTP